LGETADMAFQIKRMIVSIIGNEAIGKPTGIDYQG